MRRTPDLDTDVSLAQPGADTSHSRFPSRCNGHRQHREQELSKTLTNQEHFPGASSLLLNLSWKLLQHHPLHIGCVLERQKQAMVELGATKTRGKGKSCKLEIPFSPAKQKSGAPHSSSSSSITQGSLFTPHGPDPPLVIMGSAKSPSLKHLIF